MNFGTRARRTLRFVGTRLREWRMIAWGLASADHPILAHVIPIRRCNLSCTYCNEYDDVSKPVPLEEMFRRVDQLAELGSVHHHPERRRASAASRARPDHRPRARVTGLWPA